MSYQEFSRSPLLNNLSQLKLEIMFNKLEDLPPDKVSVYKLAWKRYSDSNIPLTYWTKSMKDFVGENVLKEVYEGYVADLKKSYVEGSSFCLAGTHGTGKTMTVCNILKKASVCGYTCLYTTLSDIVSTLTGTNGIDNVIARKELNMVDFLVIDEYDNRFMSTENSINLFARTLEMVFRTRSQNNMPTIMCTNSPNINKTLTGPLKDSLTSIMSNNFKFISVIGDDFRQKVT